MHYWYHVYTLSDRGKIFYVGISKNIEKRYKGHLSGHDMCTGHIIYWMRQEGRLPELELLLVAHNKEQAELAETALIRQLCLLGNRLCNDDCNPIYNRIITCNPEPNRQRIKRVKKNIVPNIVQEAKDRLNRLTFYYAHERRDRLQYLGNSAMLSQ